MYTESLFKSLKVLSFTFIVAIMSAGVLMCRSSAMKPKPSDSDSRPGTFDFGPPLDGDESEPESPSTPIVPISRGIFGPPLNSDESEPGSPSTPTIPISRGFFGLPLISDESKSPSTITGTFGFDLIGSRSSSPIVPLPTEFSWESPFWQDRNQIDDLDRYPNIYSLRQNESTRHPRQTNSRYYMTKGGKLLNASKVIRVENEDPSKKFSIIATQAPMKNTFGDFLDLLYTGENVDGVVVLGKASEYWTKEHGGIPAYFSPDFAQHTFGKDSTAKYGDYYFTRPMLDNTYRGVGKKYLMTISKDGREKEVPVYHFFDWSDRNVPDSVEDFVKFVKQFEGNRKLVVHCSAGVGRTGVFAAYLYALRTGETNPKKIVKDLRQYRMMVQTPGQFNFLCYLCKNLRDELEESFDSKINYTRLFEGE